MWEVMLGATTKYTHQQSPNTHTKETDVVYVNNIDRQTVSPTEKIRDEIIE